MIFQDKSFSTKKELFSYLKDNKKTILDAKKAEIKCKNNADIIGFYDKKESIVKNIPSADDDYIYPVISNTNYLDSHKDVHLTGSMTKTSRDQNGKVYYVTDHKLEVNSVIATPDNVEIQLLELPWTSLGKNYPGTTEAMIFKIKKSEIMHEKFNQMLSKGKSLQNSIRMQYIKTGVGINDTDTKFKNEYQYWNKHYNSVANKEQLNEDGFFFGVEELKIVMEGSAVLFGSNDATPTKEVGQSTSQNKDSVNEPSKQEVLDALKKSFKLN